MAVVVVESPAKAKKIGSYLGNGFSVLASKGHVRDLLEKSEGVDPSNHFVMTWQSNPDQKAHIKAIADAVKGDQELILATDPDREGEAISWHLVQTLQDRRALKATTVIKRVVFNAITKSAVTSAMAKPREIDAGLVEAYLARRATDHLFGFGVSPLLWKKLSGAKSAGRVQSVCLRLIVERQQEINAFQSREYWSVLASLASASGEPFEGRLTELSGKKLANSELPDGKAAEAARSVIEVSTLSVRDVKSSPVIRNPAAPFMTSTLQQEASRKLGMGAKQAMSVAQRLYEAGHITYMRTDGIEMAPEAIEAARIVIRERFGDEYVPATAPKYVNKAKNAQEAHECIRPTEMAVDAAALKVDDDNQRNLYDLIWKRTLASQMETARQERTTAEIASDDGGVVLRATGQVELFDGFLKVYEEGRDDDAVEAAKKLPALSPGEAIEQREVTSKQHFTQPPAQYSEATLVKRLEELGIGRPSTYATVIESIEKNGYVATEKKRLVPRDMGTLVCSFLVAFFPRYVEYGFTASLEEELDRLSAGEGTHEGMLEAFWRELEIVIRDVDELPKREILERLDQELAPELYPPREDGKDARTCPKCAEASLHLKVSKNGGFVGCSRHPACSFTRPMFSDGTQQMADRVLGKDGDDEIVLRDGRYGPYVQRGRKTEENPKPKTVSIPKQWNANEITLEKAVKLLSLPRSVGPHSKDGLVIEAGIGRYGPYVKHGKAYANLPLVDDAFTIDVVRAEELLAEKVANSGKRGRQNAPPLKDLGEHPDGGAMCVMAGKYGPYVKWGKINVTLPEDLSPDDVTPEAARGLLDEKAAAKGGRKKSGSVRTRKSKPGQSAKKS